MHVLIAADMEGCSGIVSNIQVEPGDTQYAASVEHMIDDANACLAGCFQGGATSVTIWDAHWRGMNMPWHRIDPRATLQQGDNNFGRLHDVGSFDALILLGYHAMGGTANAVLDHTMTAEWQNFWLNGRLAGEIAIDAAIAGDSGVPTIMVSGDNTCCREAREWIPGIYTAQVKESLGLYGARMLAPQAARALIENTAEQACRNYKSVEPLCLEKPIRMRLQVAERTPIPPNLDGMTWRKIIDGRTFEVEGASVFEALYRLLKNR